jgi:hypothetical protein
VEQQLRIKRQQEGSSLTFLISFDPGNDAGDSIELPYRALQELLRIGGVFLSKCTCTEVIQRWEILEDT